MCGGSTVPLGTPLRPLRRARFQLLKRPSTHGRLVGDHFGTTRYARWRTICASVHVLPRQKLPPALSAGRRRAGQLRDRHRRAPAEVRRITIRVNRARTGACNNTASPHQRHHQRPECRAEHQLLHRPSGWSTLAGGRFTSRDGAVSNSDSSQRRHAAGRSGNRGRRLRRSGPGRGQVRHPRCRRGTSRRQSHGGRAHRGNPSDLVPRGEAQAGPGATDAV